MCETHAYRELIYTGPVDEFFDYRFGKLPYRCLEFKHETLNQPQFQPVAVVNYPNDYAFTRITEFKHLTGQEHPKTSIVYEFSARRGRSLLSRSRAARMRDLPAVPANWPTRPACISSGDWPPTSITTWTRSWRRRSRSMRASATSTEPTPSAPAEPALGAVTFPGRAKAGRKPPAAPVSNRRILPGPDASPRHESEIHSSRRRAAAGPGFSKRFIAGFECSTIERRSGSGWI